MEAPHTANSQSTNAGAEPATLSAPELLTVQDAARFLNVTVSWVYEHAREGVHDRLPVVKLGKYLRFNRRDLLTYVAERREATGPTRRR